MSDSEAPEQEQEEDNPIQSAMSGLFRAIAMLAQFVIVLALQALRVLALIAPAAIKLGCAALPFYSGAMFYVDVRQEYGADVPASVLALGIAAYIPAALFTVSRTWGALLFAGIIELGLRSVLPHAPPVALALMPIVIVSGVVFKC